MLYTFTFRHAVVVLFTAMVRLKICILTVSFSAAFYTYEKT